MRTVTNTAELQAALAEGVDAKDIHVQVDPNIAEDLAAARAEGIAEGRKVGLCAAVEQERARIRGIHSLAPPKHDELVATAISSGMDPGTFSMMVLREHKPEAAHS